MLSPKPRIPNMLGTGTAGGASLELKPCMFAWVAVRRHESVISKSNFGIGHFICIGFSLVTEVLTAEFFPAAVISHRPQIRILGHVKVGQ